MILLDILRSSIKNTLNIVDGWVVGKTVVEGDQAYIQFDSGKLMKLCSDDVIEILNGDEYVTVTYNDLCEKKTSEGWPLLAGFDCRVKFRNTEH